MAELNLAVQHDAEPVVEVRCDSTLQYKIVGDLVEVKCSHIRCTRGNSIVFHYYDGKGNPVKTIRLQDPERKLK